MKQNRPIKITDEDVKLLLEMGDARSYTHYVWTDCFKTPSEYRLPDIELPVSEEAERIISEIAEGLRGFIATPK